MVPTKYFLLPRMCDNRLNFFLTAIGEVEVMAPGPADVAKAQELVEAFMDAHQLASASVPLGKLLASIKALRPKHWRALVAALAHKYPQLMG